MEGYCCGVETPGFVIIWEVLSSFKDVVQSFKTVERYLSIPVIFYEIGHSLKHVLLE